MRAGDVDRVLVVGGEMIGDAGDAGVHVAAAELLGGDLLAGRRLHQRRAAEEDRAGAAHDDVLVAHRRHVGAARRARAHDHGDLRMRRAPTGAPGCRRCARSARGRGRSPPAAAGRRRRSRPGRRTAGGSPARSPARAGASSPSAGSRCRPSPSRRWRRSPPRGPWIMPMPVMMPAAGASPPYMP